MYGRAAGYFKKECEECGATITANKRTKRFCHACLEAHQRARCRDWWKRNKDKRNHK